MENIELEFILERERRYLLKNPFKAIALALSYLEDFLNLSREFKQLEQKYQSVIEDNQKLTSQLLGASEPVKPRIPSFLRCHRH